MITKDVESQEAEHSDLLRMSLPFVIYFYFMDFTYTVRHL